MNDSFRLIYIFKDPLSGQSPFLSLAWILFFLSFGEILVGEILGEISLPYRKLNTPKAM